MNMAFLMFLDVPCVSLYMIVKQSGLTGHPVELLCWWIVEGVLLNESMHKLHALYGGISDIQ